MLDPLVEAMMQPGAVPMDGTMSRKRERNDESDEKMEDDETSQLLFQRISSVIGMRNCLNRDLVLKTPLNLGKNIYRTDDAKTDQLTRIIKKSDHWNIAMEFNWNAICPNGLVMVIKGGDGTFELTPTSWFQRHVLEVEWKRWLMLSYIRRRTYGHTAWTYGPSKANPDVIVPISLHPSNYTLHWTTDRNNQRHYLPSPRDLPETSLGEYTKMKQRAAADAGMTDKIEGAVKHHIAHDLMGMLDEDEASSNWSANIPKFLAADCDVSDDPENNGTLNGAGWEALWAICELRRYDDILRGIIDRQAHRPYLAMQQPLDFTQESTAADILKSGRPLSYGVVAPGPVIGMPMPSMQASKPGLAPMPLGTVDTRGIPTHQYAEDALGIQSWEFAERQAQATAVATVLAQQSIEQSVAQYNTAGNTFLSVDLRTDMLVERRSEHPLANGAVSFLPPGMSVSNVKLPEITDADLEQISKLERRVMQLAGAPFEILGGTVGSRVATADLTKFAVNMPIQRYQDELERMAEKAYWRISGTGLIAPIVWVAQSNGVTVTDDHIRDTMNDINVRITFRPTAQNVTVETAIDLRNGGWVSDGYVASKIVSQYDVAPSCIPVLNGVALQPPQPLTQPPPPPEEQQSPKAHPKKKENKDNTELSSKTDTKLPQTTALGDTVAATEPQFSDGNAELDK